MSKSEKERLEKGALLKVRSDLLHYKDSIAGPLHKLSHLSLKEKDPRSSHHFNNSNAYLTISSNNLGRSHPSDNFNIDIEAYMVLLNSEILNTEEIVSIWDNNNYVHDLDRKSLYKLCQEEIRDLRRQEQKDIEIRIFSLLSSEGVKAYFVSTTRGWHQLVESSSEEGVCLADRGQESPAELGFVGLKG